MLETIYFSIIKNIFAPFYAKYMTTDNNMITDANDNYTCSIKENQTLHSSRMASTQSFDTELLVWDSNPQPLSYAWPFSQTGLTNFQ